MTTNTEVEEKRKPPVTREDIERKVLAMAHSQMDGTLNLIVRRIVGEVWAELAEDFNKRLEEALAEVKR